MVEVNPMSYVCKSNTNVRANWLLSFSEDVLEKPMAEHRFTEAPTTYQIKLFSNGLLSLVQGSWRNVSQIRLS
jgi:hypothetical protein